ncbi:hypothetical protein AAG570_001689 [Ranatra chinensis]|uniref:Uncharacterized protein n=1 Tax=Ranatra chinensis TaxID=642074 RepID=A0ABD0YB69_9HEMI
MRKRPRGLLKRPPEQSILSVPRSPVPLRTVSVEVLLKTEDDGEAKGSTSENSGSTRAYIEYSESSTLAESCIQAERQSMQEENILASNPQLRIEVAEPLDDFSSAQGDLGGKNIDMSPTRVRGGMTTYRRFEFGDSSFIFRVITLMPGKREESATLQERRHFFSEDELSWADNSGRDLSSGGFSSLVDHCTSWGRLQCRWENAEEDVPETTTSVQSTEVGNGTTFRIDSNSQEEKAKSSGEESRQERADQVTLPRLEEGYDPWIRLAQLENELDEAWNACCRYRQHVHQMDSDFREHVVRMERRLEEAEGEVRRSLDLAEASRLEALASSATLQREADEVAQRLLDYKELQGEHDKLKSLQELLLEQVYLPRLLPLALSGGPDGVVVSVCNYHAEGPGFDSLREENVGGWIGKRVRSRLSSVVADRCRHRLAEAHVFQKELTGHKLEYLCKAMNQIINKLCFDLDCINNIKRTVIQSDNLKLDPTGNKSGEIKKGHHEFQLHQNVSKEEPNRSLHFDNEVNCMPSGQNITDLENIKEILGLQLNIPNSISIEWLNSGIMEVKSLLVKENDDLEMLSITVGEALGDLGNNVKSLNCSVMEIEKAVERALLAGADSQIGKIISKQDVDNLVALNAVAKQIQEALGMFKLGGYQDEVTNLNGTVLEIKKAVEKLQLDRASYEMKCLSGDILDMNEKLDKFCADLKHLNGAVPQIEEALFTFQSNWQTIIMENLGGTFLEIKQQIQKLSADKVDPILNKIHELTKIFKEFMNNTFCGQSCRKLEEISGTVMQIKEAVDRLQTDRAMDLGETIFDIKEALKKIQLACPYPAVGPSPKTECREMIDRLQKTVSDLKEHHKRRRNKLKSVIASNQIEISEKERSITSLQGRLKRSRSTLKQSRDQILKQKKSGYNLQKLILTLQSERRDMVFRMKELEYQVLIEKKLRTKLEAKCRCRQPDMHQVIETSLGNGHGEDDENRAHSRGTDCFNEFRQALQEAITNLAAPNSSLVKNKKSKLINPTEHEPAEASGPPGDTLPEDFRSEDATVIRKFHVGSTG